MNAEDRQQLNEVATNSAATRAIVEEIKDDLAAGRERFADHDGRLRAMETRTARMQAIGAAGAFLLTLAIGAVAALAAWFKPMGLR